MEQEEALQSLETIKSVIAETRQEMSISGQYWMFWGILTMIACTIEQSIWLSQGWLPHLILWGTHILCGLTGTIILNRRGRQRRIGKPFGGLTRKLGMIWLAIFVFIWFLTYLAVGLRVFQPVHIWALATLTDALGLFITGILLSSRSFIIMSLIGLPVVVFMALNPYWQATAFGLYFGGGSAIIGWIFSKVSSKEDAGHGSYMA